MRKEKDSLGTIFVPQDAYWGAQTARSLANFQIGEEKIPMALINAIVLIKKACARVNHTFGLLEKKKMHTICTACDEILHGKWDDQFPLVVWQTGSGTQANMNVNEVIARRANELLKGAKVHPNDDVNMSQSSNDVFPSAIHIAAYLAIKQELFPAITHLLKSITSKQKAFHSIIKVGRTHLMDAAPLTLGQEFSGYAAQLLSSKESLAQSLKELSRICLGATAVGTGLNAPKGFSKLVTAELSKLTKTTFAPAKNFFAALAASDAIVTTSSALKRLSCSLYKIANDVRWMGSGPRAGLAELLLPENEPGSSIMPGKVNPTQCEALLMVCMQVIGVDAITTFAATQGNFELNVARPLIAHNLLHSINLLADAITSFDTKCIQGLKANAKQIAAHLANSLMLATALNPVVGYDMAAQIVRKAYKEEKTLKQAALELGALSEKEFDRLIDPKKMVSC